MFNSKHKKKYESDRGRVSRRHAIKNSFIALAGVKKKKKRRTQIVIEVLLTPSHCGLLLDQIKKKYIDIYSRICCGYVVLCSANEFYNVTFCRRVSEYFDTKDKNNATPVPGQVYFLFF